MLVKRLFILSVASLIFLSGNSRTAELEQEKLDVIVIDAGHGGKDPGCVAADRHTYEKDIALDIALKLGSMLRDSLPDVKVIYTRDTDRFIPLWERAEIANKNNADLFISVHCNAHKIRSFHGTETYVMGLHKTKGNFEVSKRENKSILLEESHEEKYGDFDVDSDESYILLSLMQSAFRKQSLELASTIQSNIETKNVRKNLGVKEAGFLVLWQTSMPSILVETGYLSNADDKVYLTSESGKVVLAETIYESVKTLKKSWEK